MTIRFTNPFSRRNTITTNDLEKALKNAFANSFLWGSLGGIVTDDDKDVARYIDMAYNINPDVFAIVNQMASKFISIPYCIRDIEDKKSYQKLKRLERSTKYDLSFQQEMKYLELKNRAYTEDEYPMPFLRPNPEQTWTQFLQLTMIFLQTTGNVYWYMAMPEEGANKGVPKALYVLPSHLMEIVIKQDVTIGLDDPVDYYQFLGGARDIPFKSDEVIHIKYPNPNYDINGAHLYGQSKLRAGWKNVITTNKGLDLAYNTQKNGGAFGFIHAKDGILEQSAADGITERLKQAKVSTEDLSRIMGSTTALAFTKIGLTTDELKPFEYFSYDLKALCNVFGWDHVLLGNGDNAKYDNMKIAEKRVVKNTIVGDVNLIQEAFNTQFLPKFKEYQNRCIEFKVKELPEMQQDYKTMTEWVCKLKDKGLITGNTALQILDMPQSDNSLLDEYTVNEDLMLLEDAIRPVDGLDE